MFTDVELFDGNLLDAKLSVQVLSDGRVEHGSRVVQIVDLVINHFDQSARMVDPGRWLNASILMM